MKYLKTYTEIITGSIVSRDDGYPATKYVVYDSVEKLTKDYGTKSNEKYYSVKKIDPKEIEKEIALIKDKLKKRKQQETLKQKENQYEL